MEVSVPRPALRFFPAHPSKRVPIAPLRQVGAAVIARECAPPKVAITVVLCDDQMIQELNLRFLGHDAPTDVLAFPLGEEEDALQGEIYVSLDRAEEQASAFGVSFANEVCRLLVHGLLHLLGYDDREEPEKRAMADRQEQYVALFEEHLRPVAQRVHRGA